MPQLIIKTRDLDTDHKVFQIVEIDRVPDNAQRRGQLLAEVVVAHHPEARQQSFANEVASFVGKQHLIVAKYDPADLERALAEAREAGRAKPDLPADQDQLFAA